MKLKLIRFLVMTACLYAFVACEKKYKEEPVAVESVKLGGDETLSLVVGNIRQLTYIVLPENATNKDITWSSNAKTVATVVDGLVTAIALGNATITVETIDGLNSDAVTVIVTAAEVRVTGVTLDKSSLTLTVGDAPVTLVATVSPNDVADKDVIWSSDAEGIATVAGGVVTAIASGNAVITATSVADNTKSATCVVTVENHTSQSPSVTIDKTFLQLEIGATETLTAQVTPSDSTEAVIWLSSNTNVATVDRESGLVTAIAAGSVTIMANVGYESGTCEVSVFDSSSGKPGKPGDLDYNKDEDDYNI